MGVGCRTGFFREAGLTGFCAAFSFLFKLLSLRSKSPKERKQRHGLALGRGDGNLWASFSPQIHSVSSLPCTMRRERSDSSLESRFPSEQARSLHSARCHGKQPFTDKQIIPEPLPHWLPCDPAQYIGYALKMPRL